MSVKTSNLFEMFLPGADYLCRRMCCTVENKKSRLSPDNRLFKTNYLKTNLLKQIKVNTFTISHGSHIFCKDKDNYYNNNEKWWKKYKTFTFFIVVVSKTYLLRRKSYHS